MRGVGRAALAVALAACGPKIEDLDRGEKGVAAEVRDGDTFVMDSGLVVHLAGVEAPGGDQPLAGDARGALERLVAHQQVQLAYGGEKRARDAALAQGLRADRGRTLGVGAGGAAAGGPRASAHAARQHRPSR